MTGARLLAIASATLLATLAGATLVLAFASYSAPLMQMLLDGYAYCF